MVGDSQAPLFRVAWHRPKGRSFDPPRWVRKRFRSRRSAAAPPDAPAAPGIDTLAWVRSPEAGRRAAGSVWCGFARAAGLILELVTGGNVSAAPAAAISARVIPSLTVSQEGSPTRWAVFGTGFTTPTGFRPRDRRLALGDIALLFQAPGGRRLLVRQVYPAKLALARRQLARWLEGSPFRERRRYHPIDTAAPWSIGLPGRTADGVRRHGWKRLPFPLGGVSARQSVAAVVLDPELDRLLIAEYDAPAGSGENIVADAIAAMNRTRDDAGGVE